MEGKITGTKPISLMRVLALTREIPFSRLLPMSNNLKSSRISNCFFSNIQSSFNMIRMPWNSTNNSNSSQVCNTKMAFHRIMLRSSSMRTVIKTKMMRNKKKMMSKRTKKVNSSHSLQARISNNSSNITSNSNNYMLVKEAWKTSGHTETWWWWLQISTKTMMMRKSIELHLDLETAMIFT